MFFCKNSSNKIVINNPTAKVPKFGVNISFFTRYLSQIVHNLVSFRSSLGLTVAGAVITEAEVAAGANTSSDNGSLNSNLQVRDKTFLNFEAVKFHTR